MTKHGLTDAQLKIIQQVLAPFASDIERVGLFGSRATGHYRPNSDVDIVLYGALDEPTVDRIFTLLNESSLPMKVDVVAYHLIDYLPLKEHVDDVMASLLTHEELISENSMAIFSKP